ncbi:MAG: hypothetical protein LBU14_04290 [Candidatus Peribacteria bacterium]|jgi:hypothetical protein|nr:hypothetical protein [Candidatus Peribacteria bacterium]
MANREKENQNDTIVSESTESIENKSLDVKQLSDILSNPKEIENILTNPKKINNFVEQLFNLTNKQIIKTKELKNFTNPYNTKTPYDYESVLPHEVVANMVNTIENQSILKKIIDVNSINYFSNSMFKVMIDKALNRITDKKYVKMIEEEIDYLNQVKVKIEKETRDKLQQLMKDFETSPE